MGTRKERTKQGTFGFVEPGSVSPDGRTLEHGFPPGIAMTAPAPGAGEEAGGRVHCMGTCPRRKGRPGDKPIPAPTSSW
jgi:hypothetical protein